MTPRQGTFDGRAVAKIDPFDWSLHPFMAYALIRQIDVRFYPVDNNVASIQDNNATN